MLSLYAVDLDQISDQLNEVHHAPREASFQIPETHRPTHPKLEGSYVCNVTLFSLPTRVSQLILSLM